MKKFFALLSVAAALTFATGCTKSEPAATPPAPSATDAPADPAAPPADAPAEEGTP